MAQISNKNQHLAPIVFNPVGGLNLAMPPHAIKDVEMQQADNVIFMPHSGQIAVRPGFSCVNEVPAAGGILNIHPFKDKLICSVSDGKVYVYDIIADTFTELHSIGASVIASFLNYHDKLLIADGVGLYSWTGNDADDVVEIITSIHPTTITEISNRVVINDKLDLDAVFLSGPFDEEDWDAESGAAIHLRAGFGDGMNVNGFAVIGRDLIVSKTGDGRHFLYRVNTAQADPKTWQVQKLITDTSAGNEFLIESVPNQVMYINEDAELRSLEGVQEYGDIRMMNAGEKINPMLVRASLHGRPPSMIRYIPTYDILVLIYTGVVGLFHHASNRFTTTSFENGQLRCCCDFKNEMFWGSQHGYIYTWNESTDQDEPNFGTFESFTSNLKSKIYAFPGESIVKTSSISFSNFVEGAGTVRINNTKVIDFPILGSPWYIFEADDTFIHDADMLIYERGEADSVKKGRNRVRQKDFFIHVTVTDGRAGFNYVDCLVAQVNG